MSGILNSLKSLTAAAKHGQDTRMRFSVVPPPPGDTGFEQWRDAMRMVARLPGGIPPEFRRRLWLTLAEKHLQSRGVDWSRAERMCLNEWRHPDDEQLGIQIVKDLHRTGCSLFCGGTEGAAANQAVLKRVLLGFARWNKAVGYCQGFNMLAALILQVTERSEADAIKVMIYLIEGVLPEGYFADHLRGLSVDMAVFRDLLRLRLPALSRHLETLQHDARDSATGAVYEPPLTNVFTMQWFLTLFCNCLPRAAVLRVWDLVFLEGSEVLLRTALAIWDGLQDRIMAVGSADEFYSIMGVLTREMLEFGLMDSNNLIKAIVSMGPFPFPGLSELRDRHLYNITPWSRSVSAVARRGLGRIFYAGEEEEEEEEEDDDDDVKWNRRGEGSGAEREAGERLAVATAFGLSAVFRSPRRRDSHPPSEERGSSRLSWGSGSGPSPSGATSAPPPSTAVDRERLSLDVWALRRQYTKLRERQRQAHVILTAACARQMGPSPSAPSHGTAVNHLLLGKSALLPPRGRRRGPPPGSVPAPLRRIHPPPPPPPPVRKEPPPPPPLSPEESGETLLWRDAKRRPSKGRRRSDSGSSVLTPLNEVEDLKQELQENISDEDKDESEELKLDDKKNKQRLHRTRTYSSDSGSSSTELCDEDAPRLSDLDSSGEGVSPVPPAVLEEENTKTYSPPKSPLSEEEHPPLSAVASAECGMLWESVAAQENASKEGRLSSSTMTPGLEDEPLSPKETTSFKLPELYLPPTSPPASTHLSPLSPSVQDPTAQGESPMTLLGDSPQQLTPFSSPTTSSASEQSPSTTSSPDPNVPTPSSSDSSPQFSGPANVIPQISANEKSKDLKEQETITVDTDNVFSLTTEPETFYDTKDSLDEGKLDDTPLSPVDIDALLSKWPHLKLQSWSTDGDKVDDETKNSLTILSPGQKDEVRSMDLSPLEPLETNKTKYDSSDFSTLLPSTSITLPLPTSSTTPPLYSPTASGTSLLSSNPSKFFPVTPTSPKLPPSSAAISVSNSPKFLPLTSTSPPLVPSSVSLLASSPPKFLPLTSTSPPLAPSTSSEPFMPTSTVPSFLTSSNHPNFLPTSSAVPTFHPTSSTTPPLFLTPISDSPPPLPPMSIPSTIPSTKPLLLKSFSTPPPISPSSSPPPTYTTPSSTPPPYHATSSSPPPLFTSSSKVHSFLSTYSTHTLTHTSSDIPSSANSSCQRSIQTLDIPPIPSTTTSHSSATSPLTKPFSLPSLPLKMEFPTTCDTESSTTVKSKDRASLSLWDWLPEESRIIKKTKSGSSPSSLLGSPVGSTSRTLAEGYRPSSPPKISPSLGPRRHSERALRIIQENSEILQRIQRQPPHSSPPSSPSTSFPTVPGRFHTLEGDALRSLSFEGGDKSPHSPVSPASSSWPLDNSTDISASASSKSPANSPVALGDVVSWGLRRGTLGVSVGSKLPSPTSPSQPFNPFPQRATWRQPKELGVKLGLYSATTSPSPPTAPTRSSPTTPTSPTRSSFNAYPKQTFK